MSVKQTGVFSNWLPWLPGDTNQVEKGKVSKGVARCKVSMFASAVLVLATIALVSGCGGGSDEAEVQSDEAEVQPVVRAERFEVVDKDGNVRAFLTTLEDGSPTLNLLDENGESRAWMLLSNDGSPRLILMDEPLLVLMDGSGEFRSVLSLDQDGSPNMSLVDGAGVFRSVFRLGPDGSPALLLNDGDGELTWFAPGVPNHEHP